MTSFGTTDVMHQSGASRRQLNYWASNGVLLPSVMVGVGSGVHHRYSAADIERAKVLAAISQLGATSPILTRVREALDGEDMTGWPLLLFVLVDGTVSTSIVPGVACYVVDVGGLCAAGFGRRRVHTSAA